MCENVTGNQVRRSHSLSSAYANCPRLDTACHEIRSRPNGDDRRRKAYDWVVGDRQAIVTWGSERADVEKALVGRMRIVFYLCVAALLVK